MFPANPNSRGVRWAWLADLHVSGDPAHRFEGLDPARNFETAAAQVLASGCRATLVAGDLAWKDGLQGDYARLKRLFGGLAARLPVCVQFGNHDTRENMLPGFGLPSMGRGAEGPAPVERAVTIVDHPPVRWILLDSLFRVDLVPGFLGKRQRNWLRDYLARADETPTLICVHHPPDDEDFNLLDSARFLEIVAPFRQVKAVVFGHSHAYTLDRFEGIHLIGLPAVGFPFQPGQPIGWVEAAISLEGAALKLHPLEGSPQSKRPADELRWRA